MDRSDEKTTGSERRTSQRLSRQLSVHASTDLDDSVINDAYLAAMGISVSNGFRPSDNAAPTLSEATNTEHHHATSISIQKTPETNRRPSSSDESCDGHMSATTGTAPETSSISTSISTSSSSLNSSEPSPSEASALPFSQPPLQPSSALVPETEAEEQEESSASAFTSIPSQLPPASQQPTTTSRGRPSSIAKSPISSVSPGGAATFTAAASSSRDNGGNGNQRAANVRESTASSVAPTPQQDEPYQGPSGPSFPYQMYPQNVGVTRTLSDVTASTTAQSESPYTGPRGPAFPYGMYPQNTMTATAAGTSTIPTSAIPVGFPGMADNYQRRIGPDGEEIADMIGPDGHTEQLPPYTRYPDEAYTRKIAAANGAQQPDLLTGAPMLAQGSVPVAGMFPDTVPIAAEGLDQVPRAPTPDTASAQAPESEPAHTPEVAHAATAPAVPAPALIASPAAVAPATESIPGAGGIGLAPRNPEYDGAEEVGSPRTRSSLRSFNSDGTGPEINTAARGISEKRKPLNFIQRYGGRRILGIIPYWAICLVLTSILIMCIILGAVLGTFVARHKRAQSHNESPQSITVTVDATPIPTPTDLAALPTGTYSLPLQKDMGPGSCFNDTTQAQAWSCDIPFQYGMSMSINSLNPTPDGPLYNLSINCNMSATVANNVFFYGEQAPVITAPMPMLLVNDTLDPNRGPAWFKMMAYDKTVVVHETWLSATTTAAATGNPSNKKRAFDNAAPASIVWGKGGNPFHRNGVDNAQAGDKPWVCTWPDTILEVFIYPNQNSSMYKLSLSPSYTPSTLTSALPSGSTAIAGRRAAITPTTGLTMAGTTPTPFPAPTWHPDFIPPFPRVVKVEERRMAQSPQATCVQYELTNADGSLTGAPLLDANGNIVKITIAEFENGPSLFSKSKRDVFGSEFYESNGEVFDKRDSYGLSKCGCQWMVT